MFKLTAILIVGIGVAMLFAGRDLTPDEKAELGRPQAEASTPAPEKAISGEQPSAPTVVADSANTSSANTGPGNADQGKGQPAMAAADAEPQQPDSPATAALNAEVQAAVQLALQTDDAQQEPAEPATAAQAETAAEPNRQAPVWFVTGNRVNVRSGPSTDYDVVGQVTLGEAAEVLSDTSNGWVRIRIEGDGVEGFISSRFLTKTEPNG